MKKKEFMLGNYNQNERMNYFYEIQKEYNKLSKPPQLNQYQESVNYFICMDVHLNVRPQNV